MLGWILLLVIVVLVTIKLVRVSLFWTQYDLPYESFPRYIYRMLWQMHHQVLNEQLMDNARTYGPVYGSFQGLTPALIVSDLDIVKEVCIKQFGNFFKRSLEANVGNPLWDNTITHLPYDEWKALRTVMGYTFTASKMRGIIRKLDTISKRLVVKFEAIAESDGNELELKKYLKGYAMDSMGAIALGLDLNCIDNPDHPFVRHVADVFKPGLAMLLLFVMPRAMKYIPFVHFPPKKTTDFFCNVAKQVIHDKRNKLDEVIANGTADIMDQHLIAQREDPKVVTDEILASQAFLFVIAGLDTTANTLEFVTYYLTVHPDVQERAYQEIKAVMGDRTEISYDDIFKFRYLEGCILESLRVSPSPAFFDRVCSNPTELAGVKFEKGMVVGMVLSSIHRNPRYFPDPDKFLPERFLKTNETSEQDLSAFLFFGEGPKNCVGKRLALYNMQAILANLLLKVRLEKTSKTPIPLRVKKGMHFSGILEDPLFIRLVKR